jgi:hypothetical protein
METVFLPDALTDLFAAMQSQYEKILRASPVVGGGGGIPHEIQGFFHSSYPIGDGVGGQIPTIRCAHGGAWGSLMMSGWPSWFMSAMQVQPHRSLNYKTPKEFSAECDEGLHGQSSNKKKDLTAGGTNISGGPKKRVAAHRQNRGADTLSCRHAWENRADESVCPTVFHGICYPKNPRFAI